MNNAKVCQPLSESEHKIDLKGRMNNKVNRWMEKSNLELITHLDLSQNPDLINLPDFVYKASNLIELDISNTKISDFEETICQLQQIKKIIGTHNNYKNNEIPLHTFCIQSLQVLDMSYSNIRYLDEYVGKLKNLKELHLRNNQIYKVPLMIQQIPEISLVDFRNNFIENDEINTIHDCTALPSDKREDCREDILDTMSCIFYYETPFQRGEPLRKIYTDLAGLDLDEFESVDATPPLERDPCYINWVVWMLDYAENDQSYLLGKTIRGITLRELRYKASYQKENVSPFCYGIDWPFFEDDYEPKKKAAQAFEIVPEEFRKTGWATKFTSWYKGDEYYWIPDQCQHLEGLKEHIERKIQK